ncbi:MAG: hypothetical protein ACRC6I_09675, partial [Paracoccaceae bacterium]
LIGLHPDLAATPAARWLDQHAGGATLIMRLSQMAEVCATAARGVGLALLPCILGDATADLQRAHPAVLLQQPLTLLSRRDVADDPGGRKVIAILARALRREKAALAGDRAISPPLVHKTTPGVGNPV